MLANEKLYGRKVKVKLGYAGNCGKRFNGEEVYIVSALPRLLYGPHFLQTFVHVHFMVLLSVS